MKLPLGENIKTLRRSQHLTQEQLAERLNVSPQSVSRWELGVCYPDMELLPGIAHFFGVTMDELMGMADIRNQRNIHDIFSQVFALERTGQWEEAVSLLRDALTRYPNDAGFLSELALALTRINTPEAHTEAIRLSEHLLDDYANEKLGHTIRANLCFLYEQDGQHDKALSLARTLPHIWESREVLLPALTPPDARDGAQLRSFSIASQVLHDLALRRPVCFSLGYAPQPDDAHAAALLNTVAQSSIAT